MHRRLVNGYVVLRCDPEHPSHLSSGRTPDYWMPSWTATYLRIRMFGGQCWKSDAATAAARHGQGEISTWAAFPPPPPLPRPPMRAPARGRQLL